MNKCRNKHVFFIVRISKRMELGNVCVCVCGPMCVSLPVLLNSAANCSSLYNGKCLLREHLAEHVNKLCWTDSVVDSSAAKEVRSEQYCYSISAAPLLSFNTPDYTFTVYDV